MKKAGQYDFDGSCKPTEGQPRLNGQMEFSLGIFRWLNKSRGKELKRGTVVTRVSGPVCDADAVTATAQRVCDMLNNGTVEPEELKRTIRHNATSFVQEDAKR